MSIENRHLRRTRLLLPSVLSAAALLASPASAGERELDEAPPPSSADEIETPIQRVFREELARPILFPWFLQQLRNLPPFFADTKLEARFRTAYIRQDRTTDVLNEAWAMGGSLYYRSGWLEDIFAMEIEGFTSQPIVAPDDRDGTLLLAPEQKGYSVLGIANGTLRYKGLQLTGYRQYLDLPYLNRQYNRMTPNTFEAITLTKPEGDLRFSTGYAWKIKTRNSDKFESMSESIGLDKDRGLAHLGAVWDPRDNLHVGAVGGVLPDVYAGLYSELGFGHELADGWGGRLDLQFTYGWDIGEDLLGELLDNAWNLGVRASTSYAGAVFRLGFSVNSSNGAVRNFFGSSPSYVDLMQRTFTKVDEKALLVSASYDFAGLGVGGLSAIVNFAAGFDGEELGVRGDAQEVDLTVDYRPEEGLLKNFWLRVRGSWLSEESQDGDGSDVRVIIRYDIPVI